MNLSFLLSNPNLLLTYNEVSRELRKHCQSIDCFIDANGEKKYYYAQEVLAWLGY